MNGFYAEDLAYIHHTGYGGFARGAVPGLIRKFQDAGIHKGLVVDLGCGSGIWASELLRAGYEVVGIDCSPAMLRLAQTIAPGGRYVEGSLHEVELPRCAAATALGEAVTYFPNGGEPPPLPPLFTRIRDALQPGGLFLFDVVLRSEKSPMRYHSVRDEEDWRVEADVEEEPERSCLTRRIRITRWVDGTERCSEETHRVQTYSRAELEGWLRGCGFTVRALRRYGEMALAPQRISFRARKPVRGPGRSRSPG